MSSYKEIVTKAVIGKGKKTSTSSYIVSPEETPNTVLGCWVINHNFNGTNNGSQVNVNGSFDVNVWYSYDNDTKTAVTTKRFGYDDRMNVNLREDSDLSNNPEIIVRSLKQPTVTNVDIVNGVVKMDVEKELGIEVIGDTKVKVATEDGYDDYEIIEDEVVSNDDLEEIDTVVTEDYID